MNVSLILFYLFVLLKPFYFFPSGGLGVGDCCMLLSFLSLLIRKAVRKEKQLLYKEDILYYIFLAFVVVINIGYYLFKDPSKDFLMNTTYWLYSALLIWSFRQLAGEGKFLLRLNMILKGGLIIQLIIFLSGKGRYWKEWWGEGERYMGTFNNPNQMAYVIFLTFLLICLYDYEHSRKSFWIFDLISGCLILLTKSTGVFLGWFALNFVTFCFYLYGEYKKGHISGKKIGMISAIFSFVVIVGLIIIWPEKGYQIQYHNITLITRLQSKLAILSEGGLLDVIIERGGEKILYYPQYLLFGAGEGGFYRFPLTVVWRSEIHSTIFSIWFSYGIIPTVLLGIWIFYNNKGIPKYYWIVFIALFFESLTVINYRQPFFWMILVYFWVRRQGEYEWGK